MTDVNKEWLKGLLGSEQAMDSFDPQIAAKMDRQFASHEKAMVMMAKLTAKLRFIAYKSYLDAGFNEDQAMLLVLHAMSKSGSSGDENNPGHK